jgi:hypothetical protein
MKHGTEILINSDGKIVTDENCNSDCYRCDGYNEEADEWDNCKLHYKKAVLYEDMQELVKENYPDWYMHCAFDFEDENNEYGEWIDGLSDYGGTGLYMFVPLNENYILARFFPKINGQDEFGDPCNESPVEIEDETGYIYYYAGYIGNHTGHADIDAYISIYECYFDSILILMKRGEGNTFYGIAMPADDDDAEKIIREDIEKSKLEEV